MDDITHITDLTPPRPECVAAQEALQRLLDGEPSWDTPDAATHRADCLACREELALARDLQGTAHRLSAAVVVPAALGSRILHATVADRRRRRLARLSGAGAILAASIALAVVWLQPIDQQVRQERVEPPPRLIAAAPAKPVTASVNEAREALLALTRRTASETSDQSVRLLPKLPNPPEPMNISLNDPLADAQTGASKSVQPIATSAKRAVNLFLRTNRQPQPKVN